MSLYNSYLSSMVLVWKYYTCIWSLYLWLKDSIDRLFDVGFEDVGFRQLLVPMGGQPDPGQRALLGKHKVCVEHLQADTISIFTNFFPSTLNSSRICKLNQYINFGITILLFQRTFCTWYSALRSEKNLDSIINKMKHWLDVRVYI